MNNNISLKKRFFDIQFKTFFLDFSQNPKLSQKNHV